MIVQKLESTLVVNTEAIRSAQEVILVVHHIYLFFGPKQFLMFEIILRQTEWSAKPKALHKFSK